MAEHTIFLSHSGQEKAFVEQLYEDLKRVNYSPFFDQDSNSLPKAENFVRNIFKAAEQCLLAVVVLSEGYLTSKWPMVELSTFVKSRKSKNPNLKLFPLFFKLSPSDLNREKVNSKWMQSWKEMVGEGVVGEEEIALWSEAVRDLRPFNGLEFSKYGGSEKKYRDAVVDEICKCVSPIMKFNTDHIRGCQRLCEVASLMFEEGSSGIAGHGREYVGLYGMGGVGKTTLCEAMCSYFQAEYRGRVCHVELQSDNDKQLRLSRLKDAILQLAGDDNKIVERITSEPQGLECLKNRLKDQPPVFLAVDNVGDSQSSRDEARTYLNAGLACGSKVLVTSRTRGILESVLEETKYCKPVPRLEEHEASELFLSLAAPSKCLSSLEPGECEILSACLRECQFADDGYRTQQYHPLVLRALGAYFHDVDKDNVMSWKRRLQSEDKLRYSRESKHVNDILGLNYTNLSETERLIFLDVAFLFMSKLFKSVFPGGYQKWTVEDMYPSSWWNRETSYNRQVSLIATLHGVSPCNAEMMVKKLQRNSFVYESGPALAMHDLYYEFARTLVEKGENSIERKWWMSHEEKSLADMSELKRLLLIRNRSLIGRVPKKLQEWRGLVLLVIHECSGSVRLDLGGLNSLRVLDVSKSSQLEEIVCSCDNANNGLFCYKKKRDVGCMSELRTVRLSFIESLQRIPFLKHSLNLRTLRVIDCYKLDYFAFEREHVLNHDGVQDLLNLKALEILTLSTPKIRGNVRGPSFSRFMDQWLSTAAKLKNLTVFQFSPENWLRSSCDSSDYSKIDLSPLAQLHFLSALSLSYLPMCVVELKGLGQLSKLTILDVNHSKGLRKLPDLHLLPKLQWVCVNSCCSLNDDQGLIAKFLEIDSDNRGFWRSMMEVLKIDSEDRDDQGFWRSILEDVEIDSEFFGIYVMRDYHGHKCLRAACNSRHCSTCVHRHFAYRGDDVCYKCKNCFVKETFCIESSSTGMCVQDCDLSHAPACDLQGGCSICSELRREDSCAYPPSEISPCMMCEHRFGQ